MNSVDIKEGSVFSISLDRSKENHAIHGNDCPENKKAVLNTNFVHGTSLIVEPCR
jgi:hypothetical protein